MFCFYCPETSEEEFEESEILLEALHVLTAVLYVDQIAFLLVFHVAVAAFTVFVGVTFLTVGIFFSF
ncbi:MAG: hypothetical protein UR90_C0015G0011, partial [Parcubacteria group bacterium GW2011_GWC1_35_8]